ncbi:hypothetical protein A9Q84_05045 [Halobacteriovorax marinus]|uniref:Glycosyltransferase RgtA/B/C/D-like domain-containing protein n=1 Tax=Halobacteriovorax marinus TaxID=97084 RepID=A0A1Y5FAZ8_9BACT|nr:hypothetical protein A9Q84_05045 [Halobacteriovorax marinus]
MNIKKNHLFILVLATLFVFYFHALNISGFFQDGYLYAALGKNFPWDSWLVPSQSLTEFREFPHHPPLFFILEGIFFKVVGSDFWQARLFGLLWVFSTICILFHYIKSRFNLKLAYFSTLLLLIIPSLMKKSRFPNMDQALLFSYTLTLFIYFEAWTKKSSKLWTLSGAAWGLTLLLKGVSGVLLLPLIFAHQIFEHRSLRFLLKKDIWLAFFTGCIVFSLWPGLLYLNGHIDVFKDYLEFQLFSTAIGGRGTVEVNYFLYFTHLLKQSPHLSLLFIWSLFLFKKGEVREYRKFYIFNLICFVSYILPLSLMKFKFSHYLIPIYPSFAIIAAYPLMIKLKDKMDIFKKGHVLVLIIAFIPLYPLGVTNKVRRDKEIFEMTKEFKLLKSVPSEWLVVDESYSYWALSGLSSYVYSANPHRLPTKAAIEFIKKRSMDSLVFTRDIVKPELKLVLDQDFTLLKDVKNKYLKVWVNKELMK